MIGQTLQNRYTVTTRLGKGAMGTVYRATDSQTGQDVAIKVIARELAFDEAMLERFKREGEALRQLKHPNIVGFVDAFQHDDQYVLVLEYVSGGSLHTLVKQGPLSIERARQIALELCDALTRAHYLNIVHRDLKPENVLLDTDGTPKLTDFGVARLVSEANRLTGTGTQIGTPYYMSPEAWEGKPLDVQADIWSLGVVLYEMLSGEVPFGGETLVAVMNKVLTAPLPDVKTKRSDLPDGLAYIVGRMLTRDKGARYQSMRELGADLERGGPVSAVPQTSAANTVPAYAPPTKTVPTVKPASPVPMRLFGLAGIGVAVLALVAGGIFVVPQLLSALNRATPPAVTLPLDSSATTIAPTSVPIVTSGDFSVGDVLFGDNFESGQATGWDVLDPGWAIKQVDGHYVLFGSGPNDGNFATKDSAATDYVLQTDFKFLKEASQGNHHIQFNTRWSFITCPDGAEVGQSYTIDVFPDRVELVKGFDCDQPRVWTTLATAKAELNPADWHNLQFAVFANRIRVTLDGTTLINYADDAPLPGGSFALVTNDGGEALFDNVVVHELIPRPACGPGQTLLYTDDFEDGNTAGWKIFDGLSSTPVTWEVETESNGNRILKGSDHTWAIPGDGDAWTDYSFEIEVRAVDGSTHLNIRNSVGRYDVQFPDGTLSRGHPGGPVVSFQKDRDSEWHTIRMVAMGAHIEVWWDNELVVDYDDAEPFLNGNVGIENLNGTVYYDDVLICQLAEDTVSQPSATSSEAVLAALADPWGVITVPPGGSIVLGVAADLSGEVSSLGPDQRDAVQLAINDAEPVSGFGVTLLATDAPCPDGGAAAQELLAAAPAGIVGTTCSAVMEPFLALIDPAHIAVISPSASRNDLSQQGSEIFNRVVIKDGDNGGNSLADANSDVYKEFADKFTAKFGRDCCAVFAAEAYDAAQILLAAIESVAVVDEDGRLIIPRQALAQAVRATQNYAGVSGTISFDENGDRILNP